MPDTRKNPYVERKNLRGRRVQTFTDPPPDIKARRLDPNEIAWRVTQGRWTADALAQWRGAWNLSQGEICERIGLDRNQWSQMENGRIPISKRHAVLLDVELRRIEREEMAVRRANTAAKLAPGGRSADERFKPRLYEDPRRYKPGKIAPRDANGVPVGGDGLNNRIDSVNRARTRLDQRPVVKRRPARVRDDAEAGDVG